MQWPYLVLDLPENTTDADVRAAYQRKVRENPPEKDPEKFSQISQAYELIRTEEQRARIKIFGLPEKPDHLAHLVPSDNSSRRNIPMNVWLEALKP